MYWSLLVDQHILCGPLERCLIVMDFSVGQERLHLGGKMLDNQAIHSAPSGHDGVHLKGKYPKGWWFCYQHFTP
jgi:hypothetical protein